MNPKVLARFEEIVRRSVPSDPSATDAHPFETRNLSAILPEKVRALFDDGHYSQASLEAFKFIEQLLRDGASKPHGFGSGLIKAALAGDPPPVVLKCPPTESYPKFRDNFEKMLLGAFGNLRNPHGHKSIEMDPDECLDELSIAAYFIRTIM